MFACTAITVHQVFDKKEILASEAALLKRNLHAKESFVARFLADSANFEALKSAGENEEWALKFIPEFRDKRKIYLQTFEDHQVRFWNSVEINFPADTSIPEGSSFHLFSNGWYETIKKSSGNFSVVCFIPIKSRYPYTNRYLENEFSEDLIKEKNLSIAAFNDRNVYNIKNFEGKYLFSVKLKPGVGNSFLAGFELSMTFLSVLCLVVLITYLCIMIAERGYVKTAVLTSFLVSGLLALVNFRYRNLHEAFAIDLFDPVHYSTPYFYSIGDFLIYVLLALWVVMFVYSYRYKLRFSRGTAGLAASATIFAAAGVVLVLAGYMLDKIFSDLVFKSSISFDVSNVLNLNWLSWLAMVILCFCLLGFWLLAETAIAIGASLKLSNIQRFRIFLSGCGLAAITGIVSGDFNIFFLLFASVLLVQAWRAYGGRQYTVSHMIFIIAIYALMVSYKLSQFQTRKELEFRKEIVKKLELADDPNAVLLFSRIEKDIANDPEVIRYFTSGGDVKKLEVRIGQQYLTGYLSRYEFQVYPFSASSRPIGDSVHVSLAGYKNLVLSGSMKVSDYFYRISNTFGYQNYFALVPVRKGDTLLGTMVLELKSQQVINTPMNSSILAAGNITEEFNMSGYSYAFYRDGRLLTQYGPYTYSLVNGDYSAVLHNFNRMVRRDLDFEMYDHLIYRPTPFKLIVVSKPVNNFTTQLAAISFIYIVLVAFVAVVSLVRELWINFRRYNFRISHYRIKYFLHMNHMLYKTRIQLSMVGTVVSTLIITGIITFYNISQQYRAQQSQSLLEKINRITEGFNKELFRNSSLPLNAQTELAISSFAKINAADLNLYNTRGELVYTTQPKLYKGGFLAPRINPQAYVYLHKLHKLEYVNTETFGTLKYITAYSAIRNNRNEPMGYLSLPYLTNEQEYEEKVGVFLNALINVYTLVFVAIGFFAVFLANKITGPLTLIQKILSETKIGRKNEPIVWDHHDEIGDLIREYNTMISALEDSADKLARSERENAWREMAKQIAHEIKNPLTPLKLGVQLLEKSWKENDPNFNRKFEKFSKSFIEQIESLSLIASEFSNFAKMPDTVLRTVNLKDILDRSVEVYSQDERVSISFTDKSRVDSLLVKGDKDQLLRSFNNLIKNSVEAIPEGRKGRVQIVLELLTGYARVTICDNGNGIPESVQERIFMPNFTTKSSGTGLGLAFVKQAIENMGGSISYETVMEEGTTFYLNIPVIGS